MKKSNLKILLLIGIPASGKSTWAKSFVKNNTDWVRVSRDDFRLMFKQEQMCEPKVEDLITAMVNQAITKALVRKLNVIVDATNVREKYIAEFIEKFKYSADIDYRVFDISIDKAVERDNALDAKVGEEVIKKMYNNYKILMDSFHFQPVKKVEFYPEIKIDYKSELPQAVIFDIDGTLAIMKNRGAFEWDKVDRDSGNDIVLEQVFFHKNVGRKIIVVSGRDGSCEEMTRAWLNFYGVFPDELYLRKAGDFRKDTIVKKEIYKNHIEGKFNVLSVYDDRLSVCEMWHELGLFVMNVNQGMREF
jgi:predicted kinase